MSSKDLLNKMIEYYNSTNIQSVDISVDVSQNKIKKLKNKILLSSNRSFSKKPEAISFSEKNIDSNVSY